MANFGVSQLIIPLDHLVGNIPEGTSATVSSVCVCVCVCVYVCARTCTSFYVTPVKKMHEQQIALGLHFLILLSFWTKILSLISDFHSHLSSVFILGHLIIICYLFIYLFIYFDFTHGTRKFTNQGFNLSHGSDNTRT